MVQSDIYPKIEKLQNKTLIPYNIQEIVVEDKVFYTYSIYYFDGDIDTSNHIVLRNIYLQILDMQKKDKLDAGFFVDGILFDSDVNARLAYAELAMKFTTNPSYTKKWKASSGIWVDMDFDLFQKVCCMGELHISKVFEWLETEQGKLG